MSITTGKIEFNIRVWISDEIIDPARDRTWNLLLRRQAPYPLGHRTVFNTNWINLKLKSSFIELRTEPSSSCYI